MSSFGTGHLGLVLANRTVFILLPFTCTWLAEQICLVAVALIDLFWISLVAEAYFMGFTLLVDYVHAVLTLQNQCKHVPICVIVQLIVDKVLDLILLKLRKMVEWQ